MWLTTLVGKLEQATSLDPVAGAVSGTANAVLRRGPAKDALHGRWLGHQLHPLLVTFPIGMWSGATLLDMTGGQGARRAARRLVDAGVRPSPPPLPPGPDRTGGRPAA